MQHTSTTAPARARTLSAAQAMDAAYSGADCRLVLDDGRTTPVQAARWAETASASDVALLVEHCAGPTLDVGCGPGRLSAAVAARAHHVLGIDISPVAVRQTRARGAAAAVHDVFDDLPRRGRWQHLLLADGNIGIGGSPTRLLRRARQLLSPDGTVVVEVTADDGVRVHSGVRLRLGQRETAPFSWATVGTRAMPDLAAATGFDLLRISEAAGRHVAVLRPRAA